MASTAAVDLLVAATAHASHARACAQTGRPESARRHIAQARRALEDAETAFTDDQPPPTRVFLAVGAPDTNGIRPFGGAHLQEPAAREAAGRLGPDAEVLTLDVLAPWELAG
ncbi:hypothetical protein [Parafrankia sp. EUN1f]|uniref:hypothetical protein n=1 Tax=Parafrankia sp. EUN1f TaxID=102897 RepID=UPI0001C46D28|nr:hypothetical protein [Parafrankia sp. EUN1f]EFC80086.1 hypothetical protein FrEUN1fDRAFT_6813 [Parafrankia sp. EUN1f]